MLMLSVLLEEAHDRLVGGEKKIDSNIEADHKNDQRRKHRENKQKW